MDYESPQGMLWRAVPHAGANLCTEQMIKRKGGSQEFCFSKEGAGTHLLFENNYTMLA
jgi:hypothetical protein